jgi:hypothetical protein
MDELLKKANIPDDQSMYIGELIGEPFLGKTTFSNDFSISDYSLHTRPLWSCGYKVIGGKGEIVLDSAERIPVKVISADQIIPTPYAINSGRWTPMDDYFSILDTDLTPEQAKRARYFVQPLTEMGLKTSASNTRTRGNHAR